MHRLPHRNIGPFANLEITCPDADTLEAATTYENPPTNTPKPTIRAEWFNDRMKIGLYMFRSEAVVDLLLLGLDAKQDAH